MNDDRTIEYYQKRAGEYDRIYYRDDPMRQAELSDLYSFSKAALAGREVIDLACGTGFWTQIISETARSIAGVDINSETLKEAKKKVYQCPTRFIESDLFHLPEQPVKFDGLLATYLISHVKRQELDRLKNTLRRLLQPGSPAFFCDNNPICELENELISGDDGVNTYKKRRLQNGEQYLILKNYFNRGELESIFESWGKVETLIFDKYYWALVLTLT